MQHTSSIENWVLIADERNAVLYGCERLRGEKLRLEQIATVQNAHENEHDHQRPMQAGGMERRGSVARSGAHAAPHMYAPGHGPEEEQRRFAREIRGWLEKHRADSRPHRVTVFAPPRFLGLLRDSLGEDAGVRLREGELVRLTAGELASHPLVRSAFAL